MKKIVRMVFGSHMYGLNTPNSDMDYKGIYLPELDELLLGSAKDSINHSTGNDLSKNTADDIDDEWYSLPYFLKLALKGETAAMDMLHVNPELVTIEVDPDYGWIWGALVANRDRFYSKNLESYMGYVRKQAAKYGVKGSRVAVLREILKELEGWWDMSETNGAQRPTRVSDLLEHDALPFGEHSEMVEHNHPTLGTQYFYQVCGRKFQDTLKLSIFRETIQQLFDNYGARAKKAEDNKGIDWKAVSHALRAGYQMRDIFTTGSFSYPLAETDFLLKVKNGELDYTTVVAPTLEALVEEVDSLITTAGTIFNFPEEADNEWWDRWLLSVYKSALLNPLYGKPTFDLS